MPKTIYHSRPAHHVTFAFIDVESEANLILTITHSMLSKVDESALAAEVKSALENFFPAIETDK